MKKPSQKEKQTNLITSTVPAASNAVAQVESALTSAAGARVIQPSQHYPSIANLLKSQLKFPVALVLAPFALLKSQTS